MKNTIVEIVFGFLDSGKSEFINKYIENLRDKTHIVEFESGRTDIKGLKLNPEDSIEYNANYIRKYIEEFKVERLIIEWNGLKDPKILYDILENIENIEIIGSRLIIDCNTFSLLYDNFNSYIELPIVNSDLILLNRYDEDIEKLLRDKNYQAKIISVEDFLKYKKEKTLFIREGIKKNLGKMSIFLILLYFAYNIIFRAKLIDIDGFKGVLALTFSIVLEAIPFILLAVILSSLIQLFITEDSIEKIIPENKLLGIIFALFLGFIFPVCDCASIPIASKLIRKKIPIYIAIIFMLSSPIINPTVLLATHYAFKDIFPEIVKIRLVMGIIISTLIGLIMHFIFRNRDIFRTKNNLLNSEYICNCEYCSQREKRDIESLFKHILNEFISVSKYLILGSFIASLFQIILPIEFIYSFSEKKLLSILIMVVFSYLISLCSTSDSFVAKAFFLRMNTISIIAFLISGPMIDIKNTIILLSIFKKKFVIYLVSTILLMTIIGSIILDRLFIIY